MSHMAELFWFEKYRPRGFGDVVDLEDVKGRLAEFVARRDMPHLLFYGPPGTGKTTMALALARELYGEKWKENTLELNASDERGITAIRERVKEFARTAPTGDAPFKLVVLDEADNMTGDAQQALRRIMEQYAANARFILLANYLSGIIEPIQSRCAVFRFSPLPREAVVERLRHIARSEGIKPTDEALNTIYELSGGDMRRAINMLQTAATLSREIDAELIYRALGIVDPRTVRDLLRLSIEGKYDLLFRKLKELLYDYGISEYDVIRALHREIVTFKPQFSVPEFLKADIVYKIAVTHMALLNGANALAQLMGLYVKVGKLLSIYGSGPQG